MARIDITGLEQVDIALEDLINAPLEEMIKAGANEVVKEQKKQAKSMLAGEYYKGDVANGVYAERPIRNKDGVSQTVTFDGTVKDAHHKKGTRVGEIAFINEYGKQGQPARPFVRTANAIAEDKAMKAEEEVYDNYLKSKGM